MNKLTILFTSILIFEYLCFYLYLRNWKKIYANSIDIESINFNLDNEEGLKMLMTNFLNERVKLLDHMSYLEWIDYNNKNEILEFKEKKYYLFIYEKDNIEENNNHSTFILRASYQKELLNLDFNDEVNIVNNRYTVLEHSPTNFNLIESMYYMDETINGCNIINYSWENPFNHRPIQKISYFKKFGKNSKTNGVIGIGYEIKDLDYETSNIYFNYIGLPFFILLSSIILILGLFSYYIIHKEENIRPAIIIILLNTFLLYQVSLTSKLTDITIEKYKMNDISTSALGISFLVYANIYILQTIGQKIKNTIKHRIIYTEAVFLFIFSLIFLLLSTYKPGGYSDINEIMTIRIRKQISYNMSIFMTLGIFLNFCLFLYYNK